MNTFKTIETQYKNRDLAARKRQNEGGKVVGYFPGVPEELIIAAGLFPVLITGDTNISTELADQYIDPFYDPEAQSILNKFINGHYDYLNYVIIPHSRDAIMRLYYHLHEIQKIHKGLSFPETYLFDSTHTKSFQSVLYTLDRLKGLKAKLGEWAEKEMSDDLIREAIEITNGNRALLKKIDYLRNTDDIRLSGVDFLQVIGSSMFMPKTEHNKLLIGLLNETENLPVKSGVRLFVQNSPISTLDLYDIIESSNAVVVAEDSWWGKQYYDSPVEYSFDPLDGILDKYFISALGPQMYPMGPRLDYAVNSALSARAEGAIFYLNYQDSTPAWEFPDWKKAFEQRGIPTLFLEASYDISTSERTKIKSKITQFVESIFKKVR